jgi:asparaginyl-tRNA synthetase
MTAHATHTAHASQTGHAAHSEHKHYLTIKEAMKKGEGAVSIRGWCWRERGSNALKFITMRDGTNVLQCVIEKANVPEKIWTDAQTVKIETCLELSGTIHEDKRAPTGYELHVTDLTLVGNCDIYPITKDQSPEFLLDMRHLWIRSRKINAILKVRNTVMQAFRNYYLKQGFIEFSAPILQPNQSEGGSTLFEVKYYQDKTFLTQSWQLYGEAAIFSYEKLFTISPCFRAEKSKTSRHLSEFWMAEMEQAWIGLPELLDSIEGCIAYIVKEVVEKNEDELKFLGQDIEKLKKIVPPFPRITYTDALKMLKEKENMDVEWGKDLRTVEEDAIMKHFDKPVIVTNYPKEIMAFYKPEDKENPNTALCVDVLAPEGYGEIVGGSQRDLDIEAMRNKLINDGEKPDSLNWYFDLRKYGSVPHAGYGMGMERVIAWVCHLDNIKDAIPFPRTLLRKSP